MNMQIAPGMNVLATCETLTAADVFDEGAPEILVARLEEYVRAQERDMTTAKGRDAIRSLAAKVARTKTGLDDLGKEFVADLKKQTGAVDAKRKLIRDRLDALRDEVRNPLTAFEEAEANRVSFHERALMLLIDAAVFFSVPTVAEIDRRTAELEANARRDWEEFADRATEAYDNAVNKLNGFREAALKQEADAAELIELRRKAAESEAREVAARIEAAKLENERIEAGRESERLAREAAANRLANEAAVAKAIEDERTRVAREEGEKIAAAAKLERNKKHRKKIHDEIVDAIAKQTAADIADIKLLVEAISGGLIPHVSITY